MKVKNGFILKEIADCTVVVPAENSLIDFGSMVMLNSTGRFLWELLLTEVTLDELSAALALEYGVSTETALADVLEFVNILSENNILE